MGGVRRGRSETTVVTVASTSGGLRVLADNPADIDLLGLSVLARAVGDIVCGDNSEPITVGLHGDWGSGKSSMLLHVKRDLSQRANTVVLEINPWEFDDQDDVRATLISAVLSALTATVPASMTDRLVGLMKRISWGRAMKAVGRGALTMQWNIDELVDAFTPQAEKGTENPQTLAGFKSSFAELVKDLPQDRVVILVDDLDRCLPAAVLSTLEAIKLFLAVPKMAFVLAADPQMVREAIAAGLGETMRSRLFARDYLDKIIQVPVAVPQPTTSDADSYVALLLTHRDATAEFDLAGAARHADSRRAAGSVPYCAEHPDQIFTSEVLGYAARIVAGLGPADTINPRRIKRFVNALSLRQHAASASGVTLEPDVIAKLFIIEHRYPSQLRELAQLAEGERTKRLGEWEHWADGSDGEGTPPPNADDGLRNLLSAEPRLSDKDTAAYFVLTRKLINVTATSSLDDDDYACVSGLTSGDASRADKARDHLFEMSSDKQEAVLDEMIAQLATAEQADDVLGGLARAAAAGVGLAKALPAIRSRRSEMRPATALILKEGQDQEVRAFVLDLRTDTQVSQLARRTLERNV